VTEFGWTGLQKTPSGSFGWDDALTLCNGGVRSVMSIIEKAEDEPLQARRREAEDDVKDRSGS